MKKNDDRKVAEKTFLNDRGRITNKELAKKLRVHPATVARWKKLDEWDLKLLKTLSEEVLDREPESGMYETDIRHISLLNERIDAYLQRKDLLPSEILELSEAKFHLISCMDMIESRYPQSETFDGIEQDFD
jgi:uncharacterized protein YjcR